MPDFETNRHMTFDVIFPNGEKYSFNLAEFIAASRWRGRKEFTESQLHGLISLLQDPEEEIMRQRVYEHICVWRCVCEIPHDEYR